MGKVLIGKNLNLILLTTGVNIGAIWFEPAINHQEIGSQKHTHRPLAKHVTHLKNEYSMLRAHNCQNEKVDSLHVPAIKLIG